MMTSPAEAGIGVCPDCVDAWQSRVEASPKPMKKLGSSLDFVVYDKLSSRHLKYVYHDSELVRVDVLPRRELLPHEKNPDLLKDRTAEKKAFRKGQWVGWTTFMAAYVLVQLITLVT